MEPDVSRSIEGQSVNCEEMGAFIAGLQKENGEIPWSEGGKTDPWDHVESAMGLGIAGYFKEARRAYEWMAQTQLADGSWWTVYRDGAWEDRTRDSNFSSYIAVGVFHYCYRPHGSPDRFQLCIYEYQVRPCHRFTIGERSSRLEMRA